MTVQPTYDSRETGPRYNVTYRINDRTIAHMEPISDPFVNACLRISWWDRLKSLTSRRFEVRVIVDGDREVVENVLELDDNYLGPMNSERRREWNAQLNAAMGKFIGEELADD